MLISTNMYAEAQILGPILESVPDEYYPYSHDASSPLVAERLFCEQQKVLRPFVTNAQHFSGDLPQWHSLGQLPCQR